MKSLVAAGITAGSCWSTTGAVRSRIQWPVPLVIEPATKVTFRPIGGQDIDLDLHQLPEAPRHLAYIGFVGQPERGSTVHAYDASGAELGPAHAPHWWLPGDPI